MAGISAVSHTPSVPHSVQNNHTNKNQETFIRDGRVMRFPCSSSNMSPIVMLEGKRSPFGTIHGYYAHQKRPIKITAEIMRRVLEDNGIFERLENGSLDPRDIFVTNGVTMSSRLEGPLSGSIALSMAGLPHQVPSEDVNLLCGGGFQSFINAVRRLGEVPVVVFNGFDWTSHAPHASAPPAEQPKGENWPKSAFKFNLNPANPEKETITLDLGPRQKTIPLKRAMIDGKEYFIAEEKGPRGATTTYKLSLEALGNQEWLLDRDGYVDQKDLKRVWERASEATDTSAAEGKTSRAALTQEALLDWLNTKNNPDMRQATILPVEVPSKDGKMIKLTDDQVIKRVNDIKTLDQAALKLSVVAMRPLKEGGLLAAVDSSQQSDGTATGIAMRLSKVKELGLEDKVTARVMAWGETASHPDDMATNGFVAAVEDCLKKTGISAQDIRVVEAHKPFGITVVQLKEHFNFPDNIVNQAGGSTVNKGHPPGATGVRLILDATTALQEVAKKEGYKGQMALAVIGADGGNANHRWALLQLPEEVQDATEAGSDLRNQKDSSTHTSHLNSIQPAATPAA